VVDFAYCGGTYAWAATEGGEVFQSGDALQWTLTTGVPGTWRNLTCEHSTPPGGDVLWFTGDDAESVRLDIDTMTMRAYPMELELPRPWLLEPQPGLLIAGGSPLVWHGRGWVRLGARLYGSVLPMGAGPSDDGVMQLVDESARVRRAVLLVLNYGAAGSMAPVAGGLWRTQDTVLLRDSDHVDVVELDSRVWAATNEEAFVTSGGKIRRCTPAGCAAPTIVSGNEILTVDVTPSGEAYAADAADELFRWTGAAWIATGRRVGSPKVVAPGEVIGVHGSDVLRYAAVNNQVTTLASAPQPLVAVGGHWPDAFFAVGHEGTVLRYEPGSGAWLPELHDLTTEVLRTVAVGGGRILVLGDGDTLLQLDSTGWMRADLGAADVNLTDLRITDDASLWVLGQGGASELIVPAP